MSGDLSTLVALGRLVSATSLALFAGTMVVLWGVFAQGRLTTPGALRQRDVGWLWLLGVPGAWCLSVILHAGASFHYELPLQQMPRAVQDGLSLFDSLCSTANSVCFLAALGRLEEGRNRMFKGWWLERAGLVLLGIIVGGGSVAAVATREDGTTSPSLLAGVFVIIALIPSLAVTWLYGYGLAVTFLRRGFSTFVVPWVVGLSLQLPVEGAALVRSIPGFTDTALLGWVQSVDGVFWISGTNLCAKILICISLVAQAITWLHDQSVRCENETSPLSQVEAGGRLVVSGTDVMQQAFEPPARDTSPQHTQSVAEVGAPTSAIQARLNESESGDFPVEVLEEDDGGTRDVRDGIDGAVPSPAIVSGTEIEGRNPAPPGGEVSQVISHGYNPAALRRLLLYGTDKLKGPVSQEMVARSAGINISTLQNLLNDTHTGKPSSARFVPSLLHVARVFGIESDIEECFFTHSDEPRS